MACQLGMCTLVLRWVNKDLVARIGAEAKIAFPKLWRHEMRSNTGRPSSVTVFRTFWPSVISVICLGKLRALSLVPMTLFQRPICVTTRLCWLYPVATCQAIRPWRRIAAIGRSRTLGSCTDYVLITAFFGGGTTTPMASPWRCLKSKTGAELLFEVFSQRYERGSTLATSNLPFDEWPRYSARNV